MNLLQYRFYITVGGQELTCYLFIGWLHDEFNIIDTQIENNLNSIVTINRNLGLNPVLIEINEERNIGEYYHSETLNDYSMRMGTIVFNGEPTAGFTPIQFHTTILTERKITDDEAHLFLPHYLIIDLSNELFNQVRNLYRNC